MKNLTVHLPVGWGAIFCLLFTFSYHTRAQTISCPAYPRDLDEVFICLQTPGSNQAVKLDNNVSIHNPVRFVFPSFLLNPSMTVTELKVDFGDGNGLQIISSGETKTIVYPAAGQFDLNWMVRFNNNFLLTFYGESAFQLSFNNDVNYSNFRPDETWADITGASYTPPSGNFYPPGSPFNEAGAGGGLVHILYGNPEKELRKPFILVGGFDPIRTNSSSYPVIDPGYTYTAGGNNSNVIGYGALRWDNLVTGSDETFDPDPSDPSVPHTPVFELLPSLLSQLRARGYDFIFVDFANGGDYIQRNGDYLIEIIRQINAQKVTSEENVIMGASMGGIVARYALAKMEKNGESPCTRLFFTFDTPHNGAHIPLATQALGWYFHAIGQTDELWDILNTPAARQMLISHVGTAAQAGQILFENGLVPPPLESHIEPLDFSELTQFDYGGLRNNLSSNLYAVGWPETPRKVALADGVRNGTDTGNQGFYAGDKYFDGRVYGNLDFGTVFKVSMRSNNGGQISFRINGITDASCTGKWSYDYVQENNLFTIAQPADLDNCAGSNVPKTYHVVFGKKIANMPKLDNAPGAFRMDILGISDLFRTAAENAGQAWDEEVRVGRQCFVPTWSALAMSTSLSDQNLFADLTPLIAPGALPNTSIPHFDAAYAPVPGNLRHVELDGGMVALILSELDNTEKNLGGTLNEEYNYGLIRKNIPDLNILSGGRLNINNPGPTGFVQSGPEGNAIKNTYRTYIVGCGNTVIVENGGQFNIGALDKTQHGITTILDGSTVHIKSGGTLHVTSNGSALNVNHGATLILDAGANVFLESPDAKIHINGKLVLNGDIHFSGQGFFLFDTGNELEFGPDCNTFTLQGPAKGNRMVQLDDNLNIVPNHHIWWTYGALVVNFGSLQLNEQGRLYFDLMTVRGSNDATAITAEGAAELQFYHTDFYNVRTGLEAQTTHTTKFNRCSFSDVNKGIEINGGNSLDLTITNFYRHITGVAITELDRMDAVGCQWHGEGLLSQGVEAAKIRIALFKSCTFDGHGAGSSSGLDPGIVDYTPCGIHAGDIQYCILRTCTMAGNDIGIKANEWYNLETTEQYAPSNIFLLNGTILQDGLAGVYMNGTASKGLVLMDCSKLVNNKFGVFGDDIILMVDAINTQQHPLDGSEPNTFTINVWGAATNRYFKICYADNTTVTSIPMRGNFWSHNYSPTSGVYLPDFNPMQFMDIKRNICTAPVTVFTDPELDREPVSCRSDEFVDPDEHDPNGGSGDGGFSGGGEEAKCEVGAPGSTMVVGEQFHTAYQYLRMEDFESADILFQPVANLWDNNLSTYASNCQQYIQVAKSIVNIAGEYRSLTDSQTDAVVNTLPCAVQPNPATNRAEVFFPGRTANVRVFTLPGSIVMYNTIATDHCELQTSGWNPGVYIVEIADTNGNQPARLKFVITR